MMSKLTFLFGILTVTCVHGVSNDWWSDAIVYQVYPRSFKDSNGDGIGNLNGITTKLEHIKDIGADIVWLSPIYTSPQADFGYDITNFTDVDPQYGTLADFTKLVTKAKALGLRVLLDFVPNHTSLEHPWFKQSIQKIQPYDNFCIWRDAKIVNGVRKPPKNWLSTFTGSAWEWNAQRGQYFLQQFVIGQSDLNYRNPYLNFAMNNLLPVILLINFAEKDVVLDARSWLNIPRELIVYTSSVDSSINVGTRVDISAVKLTASASVVLASQSEVSELLINS